MPKPELYAEVWAEWMKHKKKCRRSCGDCGEILKRLEAAAKRED